MGSSVLHSLFLQLHIGTALFCEIYTLRKREENSYIPIKLHDLIFTLYFAFIWLYGRQKTWESESVMTEKDKWDSIWAKSHNCLNEYTNQKH